jgi:CPA1 family monovalent cation:H+ antiporter
MAIGLVTFALLKQVDDYRVEVLLTLALVMGGYALAHIIHTSGPIAMVVSGLLIGNQGRRLAMSVETSQRLDAFWELVDEILNAVLFVLIGLEVLVLSFAVSYLVAGLLAVPLVLGARFLCVGTTVWILRRRRDFTPHVVKVMTWGGLRGGISVALALSLPRGSEREILLVMTYVIVVFSIVVQGLGTGPLIAKLKLQSARDSSSGH